MVSPQKQIASRQKQTGYGKRKLEMAKATLLRQKQIRNGKSKLEMQQPAGKSRKQSCRGKSKLYTEEVPNSWRTPKIVQDKSKTRSSSKQNWAKSVGESLLIGKAGSLRQKQFSYFTATYQVTKATTFALRKSNNSYLGSLSIHSIA